MSISWLLRQTPSDRLMCFNHVKWVTLKFSDVRSKNLQLFNGFYGFAKTEKNHATSQGGAWLACRVAHFSRKEPIGEQTFARTSHISDLTFCLIQWQHGPFHRCEKKTYEFPRTNKAIGRKLLETTSAAWKMDFQTSLYLHPMNHTQQKKHPTSILSINTFDILSSTSLRHSQV